MQRASKYGGIFERNLVWAKEKEIMFWCGLDQRGLRGGETRVLL